jgi:Arc/MetJ-type ribon-helix-helix transcriptional regulator
MEGKRRITYWNVPVPKPLDDALEAAVKKDWHRTKTEFIREVVRRELERLGFKPLMETASENQE